MRNTVFFSWQADRSTKEGRNLIQRALETAVDKIAQDISIEEAVREGLAVDKDTKGVPGSPPIFETILSKIDRAAVFVPDLTFVGVRAGGELTPNPNVLIEYGWALKSLGHLQIIAVMNAVYGAPSRESMPFDLAHHRFPITYNLPDGAADATRKRQQEQLAEQLETALRTVLESEEFKARLPKTPGPPPFKYKVPMNGRARFRPPGEPIGVKRDPMAAFTGSHPGAVYLSEGAAVWLRLAPTSEITRLPKIAELENAMNLLILLPLCEAGASPGFVRGGDGFGVHHGVGDEPSPSVVYAFTTGEIWAISTVFLGFVQDRIWLEESRFTKSLELCATFLDQLGVSGPYRWNVGMEGVQGRFLSLTDAFNRKGGPCMVDVIEKEGMYKLRDSASEALEPFFEAVFEQCGVQRPSR
jgi:hypothetical protein